LGADREAVPEAEVICGKPFSSWFSRRFSLIFPQIAQKALGLMTHGEGLGKTDRRMLETTWIAAKHAI
jgi:hypothetical protein